MTNMMALGVALTVFTEETRQGPPALLIFVVDVLALSEIVEDAHLVACLKHEG